MDPSNPATYQYMDVSSHLVQHWPCRDDDCMYCSEHFRHRDDMRYPQMHYKNHYTANEAGIITRKLASSAEKYRSSLQQKLVLHGDLFLSRWKKRSQEKRAELLRLAEPRLHDDQNAEFFEFTQVGNWQNWQLARNEKFRFGALLPYLAINKLKSDPALVFALMHFRTKHDLAAWASFDMHEFHTAWKNGQLDADVSTICVVAHGTRYGEVVPFEPKAAHRGDIVGFPRAHLLLQVQDTLLEFLLRLFDLTLDGANLESPSSLKWQAMCEEGFRASGDVAQWSSYSHQPFSAPPILDVDNIVLTATTRLNAIADHLALLQTDPAYARKYVRTIVQGEVYSAASREGAFILADYALSWEIRFLYWWICVKEEAEHVRDLQRRFRDSVHIGSPLPPKYDHALASLELVLINFMIARGDFYRETLDQRPGLSMYTKYERRGDSVIVSRTDGGDIKSKYRTDPLYWCLMQLCNGPDQTGQIAHDQLFSFLEEHLARSPLEEKARLDQIVYNDFSDLAATHQLLLAVRLGRPQNKCGDGDEMLKTEDRRAWRDHLLNSGNVQHKLERGALLRRFYEAPPPQGRHDSAWIERFNAMHSSLTAYWASMRKDASQQMQDEVVAKLISADLEEDHLAELESRKQQIRAEMAARRIVPEVVSSIPSNDNANEGTAPTTIAKAKKQKKKSQRAPDVGGETSSIIKSNSNTTTTSATVQKEIISTTKRACNIFGQMLGSDSFEAPTGKDTDWDQFVHAMKDVGFVAKNSAGSAVSFNLEDRGAIVFHRPHPVPKIDPIMLKSMGRRMKKWFGWDKDSFVVETTA